MKLKIDKTNWTPVSFGDVVAERRKTTKDPVADGLQHIVGLEHIEKGSIHLRRFEPITADTTFSKTFQKGDVLFGRRRAYLKKAAQAPFSGICSGDITVMYAKEDLLPELLPFLINNDKFFDYAVEHSAGGLSPRVKFRDLANYQFLLPPKAEQARLAELLWAGDGVLEGNIVLRYKKVITLESHIEEAIRESSKGNITFKTLIDSGELTLKTGPFGTVLSAKEYVENGVPIINPTQIKDGEIDGERGPFVQYPIPNKMKPYVMNEGDIIIGRKGEVGRSAFITKKESGFLVGSDSIRIRLDSKNLVRLFLHIVLQRRIAEIWFERYSYGTTMPGISEKFLQKFQVPIVEVGLQKELISSVNIGKESIKFLDEHNRATRTLQKSLINQIF
jgi:type I restriction enzyme S subunit